MTRDRCQNILTGGDTSVTEFFVTKTRTPLSGRFCLW